MKYPIPKHLLHKVDFNNGWKYVFIENAFTGNTNNLIIRLHTESGVSALWHCSEALQVYKIAKCYHERKEYAKALLDHCERVLEHKRIRTLNRYTNRGVF